MSLTKRLGIVLKIAVAVLVVAIVGTLALAAYVSTLAKTLPDLKVNPDALRTQETSIVYAADGSVLAQWHGEEDRTVVPYSEMPVHLVNAVVAIEDKRFWEHDGVDFQGIARALWANAEAGEVRQGGSTITQQLVKILFTDGERTPTRKIREALMAYELEAKAEKEQVLETYLNTVYFGNGAYGVESAAYHYFGKKSASLTLAESALLAGLIKAPSRDDPTNNPESALARRDVVLEEMLNQGYATDAEYREAHKTPIELSPPKAERAVAPYFVEYVRQDLVQRLGPTKVYGGGLRVHTTLDRALQKSAEDATKILGRKDDPEVAVVTISPSDGRVLAMVGGRDFDENQFNLAAQGKRQPGSSFKTFVLVTALESGVTPQQKFDAAPFEVEVQDETGKRSIWHVENYENNRTSGSVSLQAATSWSVNAVYARLIMRLGPEKVVDTAKRLGIVTPVNPDPAIALGGLRVGVSPLEMASAYGTLANDGVRIEPSGVLKVTDAKGRIIYEPDRASVRAVRASVAKQTAKILHDVIESGTGQTAAMGSWAAGKTGTTQSYRDAWFVGWSGDLSTAVWVGFPKAQVAMTNVRGGKITGGSYPARIWSQFMRAAVSSRSVAVSPTVDATGDQVMVTVCQESMALANRRCPQPVQIYLDSTQVPVDVCDLH